MITEHGIIQNQPKTTRRKIMKELKNIIKRF